MPHLEVITDTQGSVTTTTFAQVIKQARSHNEEAVVALYQHALPVIYRYALARIGRPDLVEDVVSDVFLAMVESIDQLRTEQEAGFYAWLLQIAQGKISRAFRHITRNEKKQIPLTGSQASEQYNSVELVATDLVSNPVELHEWRETLEEVGLAMGSLSAEQQVIVIGRFLAGQKIEELAQALGKQPGTVRIMQFRALNTLAKHLGLDRGSNRKRKGERV
jgi:RNA polymerase sigma-70 factor (ECF subfamily)